MSHVPNSPPAAQVPPPPRGRWRTLASKPEVKVLLVGMLLLLAYVLTIALVGVRSGETFHKLWSMTVTHLIGGRAAGLSWGYAHDLPGWAVIVANMAIETFMVLLIYPIFVLSYERLFVIRPLEGALTRARAAAERHHKTIVKYGATGLLLFVLLPFWMTGPVMGSILGFLIGLRPLVNVCVVLVGTYLAILGWAIVLKGIDQRLEALGPYVPFVFVGAILLAAVAIRVGHEFASRRGQDKQTGPPQSS